MMTYKKDPHEFAIKILDSIKKNNKIKSVYDTQLYLKNQILQNYNENDFELQKLFIGVTCIHNYDIFTNIYSDFLNLEDAINCCIASSNIPFITGNSDIKYNKLISLDGVFSYDPYLNKYITMQIRPDMWYENVTLQKKKKKINNIINFYNLYINGYSDARDNSKMIDYWLMQPDM
jgi:hypothetical protein